MATLGSPGTGFSSADPSRAVETVAGIAARRRSSRRSRPSPTPSVNISGDTVFINGQGYSVAPSQQAAFIQQQTGARGTSAQQAIQQAQQVEQQRQAQVEKQRQQAEQQRVQAATQSRLQQIQAGGYFVDPATGLGYSSREDLTQRGYIRTATPEDIKEQRLAKQEGIVYGEKGVEEYNIEVQRIKKESPMTAILDIKTGEMTSRRDIKKITIGDLTLPSQTEIQVYIDPKTGKPIKDIGKYLEEHKIPYSKDKKEITIEEFKDLISKKTTPIYDIKSIPEERFVIEEKRFHQDIMSPIYSEYYPRAGTVSAVTPLDVTLAITPALRGGFLLGQAKGLFTGGVTISAALDIADVAGYATGYNIKVKKALKGAAAGLYLTGATATNPITRYASLAGAVVTDVLAELPAQSKAELALDLAVISAFSAPYKIVKYPTRALVGGYSAYKIVTGETAAEKGLGALGILAVSPDIFKAAKISAYKISPDYVKTKTGVTGIKYTDIDLGKIDVNIERGLADISTDPLRLEFIPERSTIIADTIDPLKTLASDIAFKEQPILPKITPEQQKILDIVKEEGGIVSGSFAQQALIRDARQFQDLDILFRDPQKAAKKIEETYPDIFRVETKRITDSPLGEFDIYKVYSKETKKHLADIDPIKFGEEGFAKMFEPIEYNGLKLLPPEVRLTSKIIQSTRPLPTGKRGKVALDIAQLLGEKELAYSPALLRGYGLSKAQQKSMFLKGEFYSVHSGKSILPRFSEEFLIGGEKVGSPELFFGTPSPVKTGVAYARLSRMGIGVDPRQATIRDLLKGEKLTFFGGRKQIIIEKGRLGKDFVQPNIMTSEIEVARVLPKEGKKLKISKTIKTIIGGEPVKIAFAEEVDISKLTKKDLSEVTKSLKITRQTGEKQITLDPRIRLDMQIDEELYKPASRLKPRDIKMRSIDFPRVDMSRIVSDITRPTRPTPRKPTRTRVPEIRLDLDRIIPREIIRKPRPTQRRRETDPRYDIRTDIFRREILRPREISAKIAKLDLKYDRKITPVVKDIELYSVQVRRGGKFKGIATDLTLRQAMQLGRGTTERTLARTFKVVKTGKKKQVARFDEEYLEPSLKQFRGYKIKKGKKEALPFGTFIQKAPYALGTRGETKEIQRLRKEQRQLNKLINM